jgi:hypothetical protein
MGRGGIKNFNMKIMREVIPDIINSLTADEYWMTDIYPLITEEYRRRSGHNMVSRRSYQTTNYRIAVLVTKKKLKALGWRKGLRPKDEGTGFKMNRPVMIRISEA